MEANKPILADIELLTEELEEFEEVLDLIENVYITEQGNVTKYTALLEQIKKDLKEGKELEKKLRISELYRSALKQLPYILLNKIQPILEKKVNDLLSIITDFTIKFDISDGKIDIYLDRNIYKDKTRNIIINNASGFERFIASLAIRLALLELSNLPKINFMAIDEGWSSFDTHNINNVGTILEYLTSKFDFILTISHLIQIKEHCDIQLNLKKDDRGFSKIVY
jgi:DNA repair exonuclease SbcCD ATPase subunit